jgi:hypothetical protein
MKQAYQGGPRQVAPQLASTQSHLEQFGFTHTYLVVGGAGNHVKSVSSDDGYVDFELPAVETLAVDTDVNLGSI